MLYTLVGPLYSFFCLGFPHYVHPACFCNVLLSTASHYVTVYIFCSLISVFLCNDNVKAIIQLLRICHFLFIYLMARIQKSPQLISMAFAIL